MIPQSPITSTPSFSIPWLIVFDSAGCSVLKNRPISASKPQNLVSTIILSSITRLSSCNHTEITIHVNIFLYVWNGNFRFFSSWIWKMRKQRLVCFTEACRSCEGQWPSFLVYTRRGLFALADPPRCHLRYVRQRRARAIFH